MKELQIALREAQHFTGTGKSFALLDDRSLSPVGLAIANGDTVLV